LARQLYLTFIEEVHELIEGVYLLEDLRHLDLSLNATGAAANDRYSALPIDLDGYALGVAVRAAEDFGYPLRKPLDNLSPPFPPSHTLTRSLSLQRINKAEGGGLLDVEELKVLLREALMESYPYLAEPRLVEALVEDLASRSRSVEEALKELEALAEGRGLDRPLLATDVRILASSFKRLLASRRGKQLVGHG